MGGSLGRTEATGYGVVFTLREALQGARHRPAETHRASVQGFGNVAQYAIRLYQQLGGKVICVSCWDQADQTRLRLPQARRRRPRRSCWRSPTASAASTRRRRGAGLRGAAGRRLARAGRRHPDPGRDREPDHRRQRRPHRPARADHRRGRQRADHARGRRRARGARHLRDPGLPGQRRRRDLQLLRAGAEQHELLLGEGRGAGQARRQDDLGLPRGERAGAQARSSTCATPPT